MKNKYVLSGGLAFSEEEDMEKFKKYASEGWLIDGFALGIFYKFKKAEPQELSYCLDYQADADEEYFSLFEEAGWKKACSAGNMHIFSAKPGTKPIYTDYNTETDKYESMRIRTKRGSIYSSIAGILLIILMIFSVIISKYLFWPLFVLVIIDLFIFVFNFMPYVAYKYRVNQIESTGKMKSATMNKSLGIINTGFALLFLAFTIINLFSKRTFGTVFYFAFSALYFNFGLGYFKKYKKSLR
ncbi:DUF2812 domain-containing protein [Clostridium manihotivorum]|uniref:DUF2812 domain-containing protein n=1 Tax=Clostridium manihotivorum TaxID=2320868 RepID=A0A3R5QY30_9CLOT|nr:DUF2812 domain-containing protein [Clostridium manihotivorum]QAA32148.1 hypothetical protein C1I91_11060 [Clostridium manihotivorum]